MIRRSRALGVGLVLALLRGLPALAEVTPGLVLDVTQGVFCGAGSTGSTAAEDTIAGTIDTYDTTPEFRWVGDTVPAALGIAFGLHITVPASEAGQIRFEVTHPPMGPDGVTVESWVSDVPQDDRYYTGFHFEKDYELAPGDWSLRGWRGDRLLYEARFNVVPPELMPEIAGECGGPDLLS